MIKTDKYVMPDERIPDIQQHLNTQEEYIKVLSWTIEKLYNRLSNIMCNLEEAETYDSWLVEYITELWWKLCQNNDDILLNINRLNAIINRLEN